MTPQTARTILQNELLNQRNIITPLPDFGTSRGYDFTRVDNTTVIIGPDGGLILPAVRKYDDPLQAAVYADNAFRRNRAGDFRSGHRSSIVGTDWRCNDPQCRCQRETDDERFRRSVYIGRRA